MNKLSIGENSVNSTIENGSSEGISSIENPKRASSMTPEISTKYTESANKSIPTNKTPQEIKTAEYHTPSSPCIVVSNFHSILFVIANVISFFQCYILLK